MENSNISWTHNTQNFWVGCDKIAPECAKCYIGRVLQRQRREPWGKLYLTKTWAAPYAWQKECKEKNECIRVFTNSLSDFFHAGADKRLFCADGKINRRVREIAAGANLDLEQMTWREAAWQVIRDTPNLIWLILTKRPELIERRLPSGWPDEFPNVWLGTSVGCRQTLNKMDTLRRIPMHERAVRFVSCEPLLEDIAWDINLDGFGWMIVGGESGGGPEYVWNPQQNWREEFHQPGRRTMEISWAANLLMKARAAQIPFFFKQVSAGRSGVGEGALGEVYHEFPEPPYGTWAQVEDVQHANLVVLP